MQYNDIQEGGKPVIQVYNEKSIAPSYNFDMNNAPSIHFLQRPFRHLCLRFFMISAKNQNKSRQALMKAMPGEIERQQTGCLIISSCISRGSGVFWRAKEVDMVIGEQLGRSWMNAIRYILRTNRSKTYVNSRASVCTLKLFTSGV